MPRLLCFLLLLTLSQPAFAVDGAVIEGDTSGRKFYTLKVAPRVGEAPPAKFLPLKTGARPMTQPTRYNPMLPAKPIEKSALKPVGNPSKEAMTANQAQQILAIFAAKE